MMLFPLWFLQVLVVGGVIMCGGGVCMLLIFLILDSRNKNVW